MNNEDILQKILSATIERFGKQAAYYESEIANLNSQLIIINNELTKVTALLNEQSASTNDS